MLLEPTSQVGGQTHVIKLFIFIQGINPISPADVVLDDVLILFEHDAGYVLKLLADELRSAWHVEKADWWVERALRHFLAGFRAGGSSGTLCDSSHLKGRNLKRLPDLPVGKHKNYA
jgi:hypothetical protein